MNRSLSVGRPGVKPRRGELPRGPRRWNWSGAGRSAVAKGSPSRSRWARSGVAGRLPVPYHDGTSPDPPDHDLEPTMNAHDLPARSRAASRRSTSPTWSTAARPGSGSGGWCSAAATCRSAARWRRRTSGRRKLSLDGKRAWGRLTYFNKYPGYKASNPVVIDGRLMAFKIARSSDPAGVGYGIFLEDFATTASRR